MARVLSKIAELLVGLGIIFGLLIVIGGGTLLLDEVGLNHRVVLTGLFVAVGAVLWVGSGVGALAFWKGLFQPPVEEDDVETQAGARWVLSTLGIGLVVGGIGYGITGYLWPIIAVMPIWTLWYGLMVWRGRRMRGQEGGGANGT